MIYDINAISHNDKCRVLERNKLSQLQAEEENIKTQALSHREKLIKEGTWKPMNFPSPVQNKI